MIKTSKKGNYSQLSLINVDSKILYKPLSKRIQQYMKVPQPGEVQSKDIMLA